MPRLFHFRLERILDLRRQIEDQAKMAVAQAQRRYQEQGELLDRIRAELTAHEQRVPGAGGADEATAADIWLWRNYRERLVGDVREAERELQFLARELNRRREEAVQKSKDRQILEKLKDRQAGKHAEEEGRREQKELDEIGTLRHGHTD